MGLLAPWFLAGAVALGLPIYLHLLRKQTSEPKPFSSLMFFEPRTQSSIKHRKLQYLLLLSLRLALFLFIILAFASPFITGHAIGIGANKLQLFVIDNSLSMRAGSRLADAKQQALSLLGSKVSNPVQVMTFGSTLQAMTQPSREDGTLRAAIEGITPSDTRGNFGELVRAVRSMSEASSTPIELHLFSDLQKSDMPGSFSEMALPSNVSLTLHPAAKDSVPNWTVESVNAPPQVWNIKKTKIQAVVSGYHTQAAMRTVSLVANGKTIANQNVNVPASGRANVEFASLDIPYGLNRCAVKIDSADALSADDSILFAVQRSDPQRVLFVHQASDTRSPLYFSTALSSAAEAAFLAEPVSVQRLTTVEPSRYAFVVLSDVLSLPSSFDTDLSRFVQSGGSVLIAAGTSSTRNSHIPVFGGGIRDTKLYSRSGDRFLDIGEADSAHPSLQTADSWAGVRFFYASIVDPGDARVVARLTDRTPILLEKKVGEGRVLLLGSGLDNLTNDFPLHPAFIPFIEGTARYLSGTAGRTGSRAVGSFLELRTAKEKGISVDLIDPMGKHPLSLSEASSAQSYQLNSAGFYELRLRNGRQDLVGVNADRRESDLDVIPDDVLAVWRGTPSSQSTTSVQAASQTEEPRSLWLVFMVLAAITALVESALSSRYLNFQKEAS